MKSSWFWPEKAHARWRASRERGPLRYILFMAGLWAVVWSAFVYLQYGSISLGMLTLIVVLGLLVGASTWFINEHLFRKHDHADT